MSYQTHRDDFMHAMGREGVDPDTARLIMRDAETVQRLATAECCRELTDAEGRRYEHARERIARRCAPHNIQPIFSGDPRGNCVKLLLPSGRYNTWGGAESGWGVPTRRA